MRQSRRRTGGRRSDADKIKYIRMAAVPVVIIIVLVLVIVLMDRKSGDKASSVSPLTETETLSEGEITISADGTDAQGESVEPDNSQYTTDFSEYELQKDEIPQVNLVISEYFQAKVDQDAEKLFALFGKQPDESLEARKDELKNEAVYIEDYQDIVCYTKPGLTEESYVVYVTYEVKFRRVDTLAPGLMWCYVVKADDGNYIIRENVVGDEADYVAKQNQSEDVRLLSNQVNERLKQAIESDTLLAGIYKDLRNGAVVSSSESDEEDKDSFVSLEDDAAASGEAGALDGGEGIQAPQDTQESSEPAEAQTGENAAGQNAADGQAAGQTNAGGQTAAAATAGTDSGQTTTALTTAAGDSKVKIE